MTKILSVKPHIDPSAEVRESSLGHFTEVGPRTSLLEVTLDDYSYVVNDSDIAYARIGKFCSIASHVRINPGNHPVWRASQAHFTYRVSRYWPGEEDEAALFEWRRQHGVTIGHDVWIGHGAVVLPGRAIGTGSVVGAGAVVTKDVAPYSIVVGNPARRIRDRFTQTIAERLIALAWWDWDHERLRGALPNFRSLPIEAFLDKYETGPRPAAERFESSSRERERHAFDRRSTRMEIAPNDPQSDPNGSRL